MAANLTEADERRFAAMWDDGVTVVEILARFKIGQETMDKMRKRLGLESRRGSFWDAEREETARRLYIDEGKSASEVARILGHGATRNTIIGKSHRMGWMTGARQPAAKPRKLATLPKMPKVPKNKPALVFGSLPRPVNDNAKPKAAPPVTLASVESPREPPPGRVQLDARRATRNQVLLQPCSRSGLVRRSLRDRNGADDPDQASRGGVVLPSRCGQAGLAEAPGDRADRLG